MRRLLIFALLVAACGGGKVAPSSRTIFVAPLGRGGNDANDGSAEKPFATIAKALSVAQSTDTISVKPGTYGVGGTGLAASPGESFPIRLKDGVALVGSGTTGETAAILQAISFDSTPTAVVIMADGSRLEAFQIDAGSGIGLFSEAPLGSVVGNAFQRGRIGVQVASGSIEVRNNVIAVAGGTGVAVDGGTPAFRENQIVRNETAVLVSGGEPLFEQNSLGCNSGEAEVVNNTLSTVSARNNSWLPLPPRVQGPVDTAGASQGNC